MNSRKRGLCLLVGALAIFASAFAHSEDAWLNHGPILLKNIRVIDGLANPVTPDQDILLQDGRIAAIRASGEITNIPPQTRVIRGDDLTVLPGLIDMHTHIVGIDYSSSNLDQDALARLQGLEEYAAAFSYLSNEPGGLQKYLEANLFAGVTTILELGGDTEQSTRIRDEVASGRRIGPTIHTVGTTIEALKSTQANVLQLTSLETQAEIKALLDERQAVDIEIIKLYAGITPWEARHIMNEAHERGMRGVADFWCTNLSRTVMEVSQVDSYAHGGCRELTREEAEWLAGSGRFAMLTLTIFDAMSGRRGHPDYEQKGLYDNSLVAEIYGHKVIDDYYEAFHSLRAQWHEGDHAIYLHQLFMNLPNNLAVHLKNARLLHEAGVPLLIGTDAPWPPGVWPGEGMHFEMELHVEAGIPPLEVIRMATYNGARFLRRETEIGSIEKGKQADLLLVRGNPAENISDTRNIEYVIKGGRLLNRDDMKFGSSLPERALLGGEIVYDRALDGNVQNIPTDHFEPTSRYIEE